MHKTTTLVSLLCLLVMLGACGGEKDRDPSNCTVRLSAGPDDQTTVQTALIEASPGNMICFDPGTYVFTGELSLSVSNVTLLGLGARPDRVTFDFSGQSSGANGISVTGDSFTIENLKLLDTPGDALRIDNVVGVTIREVHVSWSAGSVTANGAYGLYPVTCTNVLIEDSQVSGASDAGFYVGQSQNIIVRNNVAFGNVAGFEIENSTNAEVYGNEAYDNTGGLLVFTLPDLPIKDCKQVLVHNNNIHDNNHDNFADPASIVAGVPPGTGTLIIAADNIEFHSNTYTNNNSVGIAVASYVLLVTLGAADAPSDSGFDQYPETVWLHGNTFTDNGTDPQGLLNFFSVGRLEDMLWDGFVDTNKNNSDGSLSFCLSDLAGATFRMADGPNGFANPDTDPNNYACMHTPLLPVVL